MSIENDNEWLGRNIIKSNQYMSLATCHYNDTWIAPVSYVTDNDYNFYFVSHAKSKHVIHAMLNNNVAMSIFDSTQTQGEGNGIQIKGTAMQLPISKYKDVIPLFLKRMGIVDNIEDLIQMKSKEYVMKDRVIFQIKPEEIYMQDVRYFQKHKVDRRIQIKLK
jgi:uncharacterized protein YhbP (UPF0306 family)